MQLWDRCFSVSLFWNDGPNEVDADVTETELGRGQPKTTSFIWTVQTYKFDLDVSDLFLLWMFNGSDASTQGQRLPSVSSAYFHILPEKKQDTTTTRSSTSTSTSASTASTGTGTGTSITSPTGDPASVTGANLPPDNTSVPAAANNGNQNTVAMAVGVSLGVLGAAMLIGLLVWQLRKRKRKATQAGPVHEADGDATFHYNNGYPNNYYTAPAGPPVEAQATPVEVKPAWAAQYNQQEVYSNIYGQHMSQYHATYNDPRGPPNPTELGTERGPAELN